MIIDSGDLLSSMQTGSRTNGWDAICAYDTERINSMFYQQYCPQEPTSPSQYMAFMLDAGDPDYYAMLSQIGPPEVTFLPEVAGKQCQVSMYLTGGIFT